MAQGLRVVHRVCRSTIQQIRDYQFQRALSRWFSESRRPRPMRSPIPNRREFMQAGAAGLATAVLAAAEAKAAGAPGTNAGGIPLRPLGRSGESVTMICL